MSLTMWSLRSFNLIRNNGYIRRFNTYNERDPAPLFFNDTIQQILKRVTGMNPDKVFKRRYEERNLKIPKYQFMTDQQLQEKMSKAQRKAQAILQMPPIVKQRQPIATVLSKDPAITGFSPNKHIFTDISYGVSDRQRVIVVRDTDGTLRDASWDERDRMNKIYNPKPGRTFRAPKLFEEENLKGILERGDYLFILERACIQFEPDDPEFQRITATVYEAINATKNFNILDSTRYYGPMCFYLAWNRNIDVLLNELIKEERVNDASDIVQLYWIIHKQHQYSESSQPLEILKKYLEEDSVSATQLKLTIQNYEDIQHRKLQHEQNIKTAHGLNP